MTVIDSFRNEYRFLSNFYPSPIVCPIGSAQTAEHAYQALKANRPADAEIVLAAPTPGAAKRAGRKIAIREDWEAVKLAVMRDVLALKFAHGSQLAQLLLWTSDALLVEGNTWGDQYWGAVDGFGQNWLGHLLMARRAELRAVLT